MRHRYKILVASLTLAAGVLTSGIALAGGSANDPDRMPRETLTIVDPPSSSQRVVRAPVDDPVADEAAIGVFIVVAPASHDAPR